MKRQFVILNILAGMLAHGTAAQTTPPATSKLVEPTPAAPEPAAKEKRKRHTRVVIVAPIRYRRYGLSDLLGYGVAGMWSAADADWNSEPHQTRNAPEAEPYVPQYYEPPAPVEVSVESNPPGAAVSINFQPAGKTPILHHFEKPGTIVVMIRADGYDDYFHEYKVGPGEPLPVKENLIRHRSQ